MKKIYFLLLCVLPNTVFCSLMPMTQEQFDMLMKPTTNHAEAMNSTSKAALAQDTVQSHALVLQRQALDMLKSGERGELFRSGKIEDLFSSEDPAIKKELLGLIRSDYAWRGCFNEMFFAAMKYNNFEAMTALAEADERNITSMSKALLVYCSNKEIAEAAFKRNDVDFMNKFLSIPNISRRVFEHCQMKDKNQGYGNALSFILNNDYDQALRGCFNKDIHFVYKERFSLPSCDKYDSDEAVTYARGKGALKCARIIQAYSALKSNDERLYTSTYTNDLINTFGKMRGSGHPSCANLGNKDLRSLIITPDLLSEDSGSHKNIKSLFKVFHPDYIEPLILTLVNTNDAKEIELGHKIIEKVRTEISSINCSVECKQCFIC